MKLDHIELQGFKSLRELNLDLRPLNLLIGANGSGKSNFISLFRLLNEMVERRFQLYVKRYGGAHSFLYYGEKTTKEITILLVFSHNAYRCTWVPTVEDSLVFAREDVFLRNDPRYTPQYPYGFGFGAGHAESRLMDEAEIRNNDLERKVLRSLRSWKVYHFHDTSDSAAM